MTSASYASYTERYEERGRARSDIEYLEEFFERFKLSRKTELEINSILMKCHGELIDPNRAEYTIQEWPCDDGGLDKIEFLSNPGGPLVCREDIPEDIWDQAIMIIRTKSNLGTKSLKAHSDHVKKKRFSSAYVAEISDPDIDIPI